MTRSSWILGNIGVALLAGLVPACSHRVGALRDAHVQGAAAEAAPPQQAEKAPPASPPAVVKTSNEKQTARKGDDIERARYPEPAPDRPAPTPPPLSEPPGPTKHLTPAELPSIAMPAASAPAPEDPPLVAALRCFLNQQQAQAVACLERFDKPNQDLLLVLLPLAARLSDANLRELDSHEATALVAQLDGIMTPLRTRAELGIEKVCFCRSIDGFGVYEPLPDNHSFRPGEPVLVYVEIQNFSNEPRAEQFVTRFASKVQILHYNGQIAWREDFTEKNQTEVSWALRRDYFSPYSFCIPDNLPPGPYTLRIEVKDVATGRTADKTIDFRVTAVPLRPS